MIVDIIPDATELIKLLDKANQIIDKANVIIKNLELHIKGCHGVIEQYKKHSTFCTASACMICVKIARAVPDKPGYFTIEPDKDCHACNGTGLIIVDNTKVEA